MIARLLPRAAIGHERWTDPPGVMLTAEEQQLIDGVSSQRRREFTTGRHCAHLALTDLGWPAHSILIGSRGEPRWPEGVIGSITHCRGYRAAAVAPRAVCDGLGIDAEPHRRLPRRLEELIATPAELRQLAALRQQYPTTAWDRLLFSCKEAVYKVWYPQTGQPLGFHQAHIAIDPTTQTFTTLIDPKTARVAYDGRLHGEILGRWSTTPELILVTATLPTPSPRPLNSRPATATQTAHSRPLTMNPIPARVR